MSYSSSTMQVESKTNAMSTLLDCQCMNTLAIDHIAQGDRTGAINVLSDAMSQLSWCQLAPTPIAPKSSVEQPLQARPAHGVSIYSVESTPSDPSVSRGDFFFHPFSFEIAGPTNKEDSSLTNEQYCFSAITLLFNSALCYHMEWSCRKMDVCLLQKAARLYSDAFSLTADCLLCPADQVLQVIMAICTNATLCYTEFADVDKTQLWNKRLCSALHFSRQKKGISQPFFYYNAFFNGFQRVSAPAA